ncbi:plasmid pRiA4b ORF-3 family protein [Candidatus Burkholderia verschuerenii]|uniref:plasmid pRiA4b ORF-3 family protein n=1 Tax=Candidatus Burkholderia verschuerenii TaxID=242163 RepID=UPI0009FAD214|nr:plasmid pRiA4b ORF-3 family protein [Candidatus Burkholderia verschuerenii]
MAKSRKQSERSAPAAIYEMRIDLLNVKPSVWRRFIVPGSISLSKLHTVLQIVMGWEDYHLHLFTFGGRSYGVPDPDYPDELQPLDQTEFTLDQALGSLRSFNYNYDFGDDWHHSITVEKVLAADTEVRWPRCIAGRNACPPEDVGGAYGYADYLAAIADPSNENHKHMIEWRGEGFDPKAFDPIVVSQKLVAVEL